MCVKKKIYENNLSDKILFIDNVVVVVVVVVEHNAAEDQLASSGEKKETKMKNEINGFLLDYMHFEVVVQHSLMDY
jgi:hypothetical protein